MKSDNDDLTAPERWTFNDLPREQTPPATLEERTVVAMPEAGLLHSTATRRWNLGQYAAAAVVLLSVLAIGFTAGAWTSGDPLPQQPDYVLLLRASAQELQPASDAEMRERVAEYSSWARDLGRRGELQAGEKLENGGQLLAGDSLQVVEGHLLRSLFRCLYR